VYKKSGGKIKWGWGMYGRWRVEGGGWRRREAIPKPTMK